MTTAQHVSLHGYLAVLWFILTVMTTGLALLFPEHPWLLAWVIFMSGYANCASHWAAREGAAPSNGNGDA